jgi:hypothetical protein
LFERIYGTARPVAVLWAGFTPKVGEFVDVGKLPATETISKHLGPIIYSQSITSEGELMESVGPVTLGQAAVGIGAGIGAAMVPLMKARGLMGGRPGNRSFPATPHGSAPAATPATPAITIPGAVMPDPTPEPLQTEP